jgi:crotonobetainyl-CoA:carnitine CoA-transferase CaiB-like acyl-CoA transferase
MDYPLDGIRVVDFTQYQQGTVCTLMLADWGADVIKVEPHGVGEAGRTIGPPGPKGLGSGFFEANNRNKRSIVVDVKKEKGKEIIYSLVKTADIFAQNFRPGVIERLGFGYEALSRINPRIICLNGSGFGRKGPLRERPGYDMVGQAMGGIMSIVTGPPDSPPQMVGAGVCDQTGGFLLSFGALLALFDRERTGYGQEVDMSLISSALALQGHTFQSSLLTEQIPKMRGRITPAVFSAGFKAEDGKSFIVHTTDSEKRENVFEIAGLDKDLNRFDTWEKIDQSHEGALDALEAAFATKPRDEWLKLLVEADVVCAPVFTHVEIAADPQVIENNYIVEVNHPTEGSIRVLNNPVQLSKRQPKIGVAPELGQHTDEILREVGYSKAEIIDLREQKVI